jgi:flagellar protein FlbD
MLTRLNGASFVLNPDLIERVESTPDTVITLVDGKHYVVREALAVVVELVQRDRAALLSDVASSPSIGPRTVADTTAASDRPPGRPDDGSVIPMRRNV